MEYEQIAQMLQEAATLAGLKVYLVETMLNTHDLTRRFKIFCVPRSWEPPYELRAAFSFFWDSVQTAYSLYGTAGLCALYHADHEECPHDDYYLAEPFTELTVHYNLPWGGVRGPSPVDVSALVRQALAAVDEVIDHTNQPFAEVETIHTSSNAYVSSVQLRQTWTLEEELEDADLLGAALLDICEEVYRVSGRLARLFPESSEK